MESAQVTVAKNIFVVKITTRVAVGLICLI